MKNIIKFKDKLKRAALTSLLVMSIFSYLNVEVKADDKTIYEVASGIETVYADHSIGLYKYLITENNEKYEMIVDTKNDLFIIDNRILSLQQFNQVVKQQVEEPSSKITEIVKVYPVGLDKVNEYEKIHKSYQLIIDTHNHPVQTRCMFCPLGTTEVPKTNYESEERYFGTKNNLMEIAMTKVCISALSSYLTWGMDDLATALIEEIIDIAGESLVPVEITFDQYQSYHNVCDLAIKERRYVLVSADKIAKPINKNYYHYFYSGKPY